MPDLTTKISLTSAVYWAALEMAGGKYIIISCSCTRAIIDHNNLLQYLPPHTPNQLTPL